VAKKGQPKSEVVHDEPPVEEPVVPPVAEPVVEPAVEPQPEPKVEPKALPAAPAPTESLCLSCERTCKSTLMLVCLCGRFLPKLRP
jgi:hypothetical protein